MATQLREAADSVGALMRGMGGTAAAQGTNGQPQARVQPSGQSQVTSEGSRNAQQAQGASGQANQGGAANVQRTVSPGAAMNLQSVQGLIGTNVVGSNGRDAGEVRNLIVDGSGQVRAAVVEWGGFLGIGERQALVPIDRIRMGQGNERATLDMTREELERLPRYESNRLADQGREQGWGDNLRLAR